MQSSDSFVSDLTVAKDIDEFTIAIPNNNQQQQQQCEGTL
jgi:hypothetical protein